MSEQKKFEAGFKVGDKVKVTGIEILPYPAIVDGIGGGPRDGWLYLSVGAGPGNRYQWVHPRNLDPVLEDERRGAQRPPIQEGEEVEVILRERFKRCSCSKLPVLHIHSETITGEDPRVRQIERREENKGREARKS